MIYIFLPYINILSLRKGCKVCGLITWSKLIQKNGYHGKFLLPPSCQLNRIHCQFLFSHLKDQLYFLPIWIEELLSCSLHDEDLGGSSAKLGQLALKAALNQVCKAKSSDTQAFTWWWIEGEIVYLQPRLLDVHVLLLRNVFRKCFDFWKKSGGHMWWFAYIPWLSNAIWKEEAWSWILAAAYA